MSAISQAEARISERASDAPMLEQVQAWAAINSGTRNLRGLADMAAELVNAFSSLPGSLRLIDPEPVEMLLPDGRITQGEHGRHLHLNVRPEEPVRILFTGQDRKSVVTGKSVSVRVELGGRRSIKKKKKT